MIDIGKISILKDYYIIKSNRIYYLKKVSYKEYESYFKEGYYIKFCYIYYNNIKIIRIWNKDDIVYSIDYIYNNLYNFLTKNNYYLFIDIEKTLKKQEICQFSYHLCNKEFKIIKSYNKYIKASSMDSDTIKFLNIDINKRINNEISLGSLTKSLYLVFKKYSPTLVYYGNNDFITLKQLFENTNIFYLLDKKNRINLSRIIQNFYYLKSEYGLFKAYMNYYNLYNYTQMHDSYEDSYITYKIFIKFLEDVRQKKVFNRFI